MAERDRSAVGIDFRRVETEIARHRHRLDGEGLVRFDHVHVGGLEARLLEDAPHRGDRPEAHQLRFDTRVRVSDQARERLGGLPLRRGFLHEDDGGRGVVDAGSVTRGNGAVLLEYGFQFLQIRKRSVLADVLVGVELRGSFLRFHFHRHDLALEITGLDRLCRPLVALERERILFVASHAVFRRDIFRGHAHVAVAERIVQSPGHGVDELRVSHALTPARRGYEVGGTAHALGARAERDVGVAEQDVLSRRDDRLQPAAAQAIDRQAGRADRQPALDRRDARDVHVARLAVDHAAEHDVTDRCRVDLCPRHRFLDRDRA